jgi:hypothetical protein
MLKGFPSWNVPLASTLNKLPPVVHDELLLLLKENMRRFNRSDRLRILSL